jgi:poly-beta-1,6-N-acetyl-D-glucosamine biosynthesis protein PgaD
MNFEPPLIERPDLQTFRQRFGWGLITISAWGFWACLWRPLLFLAACVLELRRNLDPDLLDFLDSLRIHTALALTAALTLILWSLLEWWKRRAERPAHPTEHPSTPVRELARDFGVDLHLVLQAQRTPNLVFHLAKDGVIERIDLRPRPGVDEERRAG